MIYLVDTHALVWYLNGDAHLGSYAKEIFEKAEKGEVTLVITTISLLELLFICKKKNSILQFKEIIHKLSISINYVIYDLDLQVVMACIDLNNIDEMHDRIITATSRLMGAPIITCDRSIRESGYVKVLW